MAIIFKSKLYKSEITYWLLILVLGLWGASASILFLTKKEKTILISVEEGETRLIESQSDYVLRAEIKNFINSFFALYYTFNQSSFDQNMIQASDLMSEELWQKQKPKILELKSKIKSAGLEQSNEILEISELEKGKIEVLTAVMLKTGELSKKIQIKTIIAFKRINRSEQNPWGLEIVGLDDVLL